MSRLLPPWAIRYSQPTAGSYNGFPCIHLCASTTSTSVRRSKSSLSMSDWSIWWETPDANALKTSIHISASWLSATGPLSRRLIYPLGLIDQRCQVAHQSQTVFSAQLQSCMREQIPCKSSAECKIPNVLDVPGSLSDLAHALGARNIAARKGQIIRFGSRSQRKRSVLASKMKGVPINNVGPQRRESFRSSCSLPTHTAVNASL